MNHADLVAELTERLTSALAEASRRKQERAAQRAQFARARNIGLTQRHGRKMHAQQRRRR